MNDKGYIYLKKVFNNDQVEQFKKKIFKDLSISNPKNKNPCSHSNLLIKDKFYWSLFNNNKILNAAKKLLNNNSIYFIPHTDVQINARGGIFHRDSAERNFPYGNVWDEKEDKYGVLRIAVYLSSFAKSNSSLFFLENSNYFESKLQKLEIKIYNKLRVFFNKYNIQIPHFNFFSKLIKIKFNPGDVVLFDQRLIHAGGNINYNEPKISLFFGLGLKNKHTVNHIEWLKNANNKQKKNQDTGTYILDFHNEFQNFLKDNQLFIL